MSTPVPKIDPGSRMSGREQTLASDPLSMLHTESRDIRAPRPLMRRLVAHRRGRRTARTAALLTVDFAGLFIGVFIAYAAQAAVGSSAFIFADALGDTWGLVPLLFALTALLFAEAGLYGARESRPGMTRTIVTLSRVAVVVLIVAVISGSREANPWLLLTGFVLSLTMITVLRFGYGWVTGRLLRSIGYKRRAVLVGTRSGIDTIAPMLGATSQTTYETLGFFTLDHTPSGELEDLGDVDSLPVWLDHNGVEEVIITDPDLPQDRAVKLIEACQVRGVRVRIAPSTVEVLTGSGEPVPGEGVPLLEVRAPAFDGLDYAVKRTFDFVVSAIALILLAPFLALFALAVKLTSRGPVFHRSIRPGIGGQPFRCLKFRTMYSDAEERQHELEPLNEASGAIFKIRDDPRVTPVGRFLRLNSIDELPQLINVLRGQLSLVGPRPLPLRDHARLEDWHRRRYSVLPGITGLWQISGRSDLTFDDMVRLDFLYIEKWSVLLDLTILLKTIPAVVRRRGAY